MLRAIAIVVLIGATPAVAEEHRSSRVQNTPARIPASPPPTPPCESDEFQHKAREHLALGMYAAAVANYENALRCRMTPDLLAETATAACMLFRSTKGSVMLDKAMRYVRLLPPSKQSGIYLHCLTRLFDPLPPE